MSTPAQPSAASPKLPDPIRDALRTAVENGTIDLPLLPEVSGQVLAACSDEHCDTRRLATLIQRDPSLAANMLRIANSALYASNVPIVSLTQAIARLGILRIREAALVVSCKTRVFRGSGVTVRALFRHAVASGAYAQEIARMRRWNVEEAFLCGLLHDVGKPVLLQALDDIVTSVGVSLSQEARELAAEEGHTTVGAALARQWKLPVRLEETILYHHDPASAPTCSQTAMMTHLADALAHGALGTGGLTEDGIRSLPVLESLNVYPDELETLLARREQVLTVAQSIA
jgi:putative nucleotidyltransferase with HDIG domain